MEEIEVPLDKVQEQMNEEAEHGGGWLGKAALTAAILAVFAALAALLAGYHVNEAMVSQMQASDHWSHYQAKSIKSYVLNSKVELLKALGKEPAEQELEKIAEHKKEQDEIAVEAKAKEAESMHHFHVHEVFARSVTFFQIAIAIAAVSVLTRRKKFWLLSMVFGICGLGFLVTGLW